jgi:hypothetical protein
MVTESRSSDQNNIRSWRANFWMLGRRFPRSRDQADTTSSVALLCGRSSPGRRGAQSISDDLTALEISRRRVAGFRAREEDEDEDECATRSESVAVWGPGRC